MLYGLVDVILVGIALSLKAGWMLLKSLVDMILVGFAMYLKAGRMM